MPPGMARRPPVRGPVTMTAAVCPTECDDDCDAPCHEAHYVPWRRQHDPQNCPAAPTT